jgi:hypothetical protein
LPQYITKNGKKQPARRRLCGFYEKFTDGGLGPSKTMGSSRMTEQLGKSEGGKEPPSRSINQFFELFQSSKNCLSGAKRLFRHAGFFICMIADTGKD